jgi:DNA repair exonuclease SbcCD ATPase subunit
MKRFMTVALAVAAWALPPAQAADRDDAATIAARQNAEERYNRLSANLEDLLAAHVKLRQHLTTLAGELHAVREEQALAANQTAAKYVTHEDLKRVVEKIQELDRKREEDKKLILEELRKLASAPVPIPLPEPPPKKAEPAQPAAASPPPAALKGYEYVVGERETLGAIVASYRKKGVMVTLEQVLKANPGLKPKAMRIGQKIFIPDPAQP